MLSREENELLARTGPGTPMGELMRRYWAPALLSEELPEPDGDPIRFRLLGEDLVAFRDTQGRVGILDEACSHRCASLAYGRNEEGGLHLRFTACRVPLVSTRQLSLADNLSVTERGRALPNDVDRPLVFT